jgi:hypothetical protein
MPWLASPSMTRDGCREYDVGKDIRHLGRGHDVDSTTQRELITERSSDSVRNSNLPLPKDAPPRERFRRRTNRPGSTRELEEADMKKISMIAVLLIAASGLTLDLARAQQRGSSAPMRCGAI